MSQENTQWNEFIGPFAKAIGKSVDDVTTALKDIVGDPSETAIKLLQDGTATDNELTAAFDGVPSAVLRGAISEHLRAAAPEPEAQTAAFTNASAAINVLPDVPGDDSWLATLKSGGELRVNEAVVISGIRAALASSTGLYGLPATLVEQMEAHAETLDEPVGNDFFKMRRLLTQRQYGDLFAALDVDGKFISETRKRSFLQRVDSGLIPAIAGFQDQLESWMETWQQTSGNPAAMMAAIASLAGAAGGGAMPPVQPPATDGLKDAAEGVIDQINKSFRGVGVPVAMALAYDAQQIKEVLANRDLPAQVGAANRDQMLRSIGADVSSDYVRLEQNLTRFALAIMNFPNVTADAEQSYIVALITLGNSIPWSQIGRSDFRSAALGGSPGRRRTAAAQHATS